MLMNKEFEDYLLVRVQENDDSRTKDAMAYSLMNGGKRVRPMLLFSVLEGYGMDAHVGYPCACAIEMIHTYSLVHDDLPAMDNDDLRRGKPSCHKAYDEATAILAGDGLLTKAFEVVLDSECSAKQKVALVKALSWYAGIDGMIYGQTLDLQAENDTNPTFALLQEIDHYKTSKLLTLPLVCGCILANKFDDIDHFRKIGLVLGLEFQMQDDILDVVGSEEVVGKSLSDEDNHKVTAVSLLG
ncbi:polyprenyl synthetase family protein, partial [Holdemanella biformis]